jgi:hypothetical protein
MTEARTWEQEWQEVHGHGLLDGTRAELEPILLRRLREEYRRRLKLLDDLTRPRTEAEALRMVEQTQQDLLQSFAEEMARRFIAEEVAAGRAVQVEPGEYQTRRQVS